MPELRELVAFAGSALLALWKVLRLWNSGHELHPSTSCVSCGGVAGTMELMLLNQVPVALWGIVLAGSLLQPVTLRINLSHGIRWGPEKAETDP